MDFLMALLLIWNSAAPTGLHALRVSNTGWSRATFCKLWEGATNWECYEYWEYRGVVLGKACPLINSYLQGLSGNFLQIGRAFAISVSCTDVFEIPFFFIKVASLHLFSGHFAFVSEKKSF